MMNRPHVVILGAGASRQSCPDGDKNGKKLPLMSDFSAAVGLDEVLSRWGINPNQNFEEIFSELHAANEFKKMEELQDVIQNYFSKLELPNTPTVYDYLILSLRGKDLIATFNWDPFLMQAYMRNSRTGLSLPQLVFLHGSVSVGYCELDRTGGRVNQLCKKCHKPYVPVPLLYPIKDKNYAGNMFIASQWTRLKRYLKDAFMLTIFGYGGPRTDQRAIEAMKEGWGNKNKRVMEQTAFITVQTEDETMEAWKDFIHSHHSELHEDFFDSWVANHPRRTGEAWVDQYIDAKFIENNRVPTNLSFPDLWKWYEQFKKDEIVSSNSSEA